MNNYQKAARLRAQRELQTDPQKYQRLGSQGGKAQVPKGFSRLSKEALRVIIEKSVEARKLKRESTEEDGESHLSGVQTTED